MVKCLLLLYRKRTSAYSMAVAVALLVYETVYPDTTPDVQAGLFLGADYAGIINPSILSKTQAGGSTTYHAIPRVMPRTPYLIIQRPPIEASVLHKLTSPEDAVPYIPELKHLQLCNNVVIGLLPVGGGSSGALCTLIATFDNSDIISGLCMWYRALSRYPTNLIILRRGGSTWHPYILRVPIVEDLDAARVSDYIAPAHIAIEVTHKETKDTFDLIAPSYHGWKRGALFIHLRTLIKQRWGVTPLLMEAVPVGSGGYTLRI